MENAKANRVLEYVLAMRNKNNDERERNEPGNTYKSNCSHTKVGFCMNVNLIIIDTKFSQN